MASKTNIRGIIIEFGGDTTKLTKALKEVDSQLKTTTAKLKDVNKLLKLDPGNAELLAQKQKTLASAIDQTKNRLVQLREAQGQVKTGTDDWDALQREIIATEGNLKDLEQEYKNFGSVAAQQVKAVGEKMKDIGGKLTSAGRSLSTYVTAPIVAGFTAATKTASDYEENLNKLDVAFGENAKSVRAFTDNAMEGYGLSKVAASEAAASFGALAKGVGLTDKQAADMAVTLTGLTSDLASYFNTGNDVSATALEAIFTGQAQSLKKFGVVMTETNLKQFAEDHHRVYEELTQEEKVMLRFQYVLEKTKDAQGDYARTSDGMANSTKTFQAALQDAGTAIGTQLIPIITPFVQSLTEIINKFASLPPETQKIIVKVALLAAALGPLLMAGGSLLTGIGSLLTAAPKIVTAVTSVIGVVTKIGTAIGGLLATISPTVVLIAVIVAAVIALTVVIVKNWDKISAWTKKTWEGVKQTMQNVWNSITQIVTNRLGNMAQYITGVFNRITDGIRNKMNQARNIVQTIVNGISSIFRTAHWELPRIKLPHFHVEDGKTIMGITLPKISVDWYRKAYENPYLFTSPTVVNGRGFGDGGGSGELVYGRDQLMRDIAAASSGEIVINVYASDGMNVNQLADKIQQRLALVQKQRMTAYA